MHLSGLPGLLPGRFTARPFTRGLLLSAWTCSLLCGLPGAASAQRPVAPPAGPAASTPQAAAEVIQAYLAALLTQDYNLALTYWIPLRRTSAQAAILRRFGIERLVSVQPYQRESWKADWQQYEITVGLPPELEARRPGASVRYFSLVRSAVGGRWLIARTGLAPLAAAPGTSDEIAQSIPERRLVSESSSFVWRSRSEVAYVGQDQQDPVLRQTRVAVGSARPPLALKQLPSEADDELLTPGNLPVQLEPGDLIRGMSLSPDRQQIVMCLRRAGQTWGLWLADLRQGTLKPLLQPADVQVLFTDPNWSPDGQSVLFTQRRLADNNAPAEPPQIQLLPLNRSNAQPYTLIQGEAADWSPDGRQIAFSRTDNRPDVSAGGLGDPGKIWLASVQTASGEAGGLRYRLEAARELTNGNQSTWAPDGRALVVSDVRNERRVLGSGLVRHRVQELWHIDLATGRRTQLTDHGFSDSEWQQAFQRAGNLKPQEVYLLRTTPADAWPLWSPDGRTIGFLREDLQNRRLALWTLELPLNLSAQTNPAPGASPKPADALPPASDPPAAPPKRLTPPN